MLNYASRDVDVLKNDGISPRILSALDGCDQLASPSERFAVHPQTAVRTQIRGGRCEKGTFL
jgi:hypothetical protein